MCKYMSENHLWPTVDFIQPSVQVLLVANEHVHIYAANMDNEHKETNRHHPSLCSLPSDYCLDLVLKRIHLEKWQHQT